MILAVNSDPNRQKLESLAPLLDIGSLCKKKTAYSLALLSKSRGKPYRKYMYMYYLFSIGAGALVFEIPQSVP